MEKTTHETIEDKLDRLLAKQDHSRLITDVVREDIKAARDYAFKAKVSADYSTSILVVMAAVLGVICVVAFGLWAVSLGS